MEDSNKEKREYFIFLSIIIHILVVLNQFVRILWKD